MTKTETKKTKSWIRWNAVVPFVIFLAILFVYFHFFFDHNLRKGLEWAGYKAMGAEVDIADLETSFWHANLHIHDIQMTNAEKPSENSLEIGDIRFGMLWDAFLRMKFVVNEATVDNIRFATTRKNPGRVAPPEPPKTGPSFMEKDSEELKQQALAEAQQKYADNFVGDLAAVLGGADSKAQLGKIEGTLASKEKADKIEADLKAKQDAWNQKLKSLPQSKDIQALGDRLGKVKYQDFKNPQELQASLQELNSIVQQGDAYSKQLNGVSQDFDKDLKGMDTEVKDLDAQIKADTKSLEARFHLPSINTKDLTRALFNKYLGKYMAKINRYRALAEKYLPPKLFKKDQPKVADESIQPHPREKGVTYEFTHPKSYPLLWVKKVRISSEAGSSPDAGNVRGEITNITSNQRLIGTPTIASVDADFPANNIHGASLKMTLDDTQAESLVTYKMAVASYPVSGNDLVNSPDVQIALKTATGKMDVSGELKALRDFKMNIDNEFNGAQFDIAAKDATVLGILKGAFAHLPAVNLKGTASGYLPSISFDVESNVGSELEKALHQQIDAKIAEARKQIENYVNGEVQKTRDQINKQTQQIRDQFNDQVKKLQDQLNGQKKQVEAKSDQAKKDAENQAKKSLGNGGQKAVDDLKKKFGL